jgi:hypothetical protein
MAHQRQYPPFFSARATAQPTAAKASIQPPIASRPATFGPKNRLNKITNT